jgi:hypothetical protein
MSNLSSECELPINTTTNKYLINVITTEDQIVDSKKTFYVKDRRPSKSPTRCNSTKQINKTAPMFKKFNQEQIKMDELITNKIKTKTEFENIFLDPLIEKLLLKKDDDVTKK